MSEHHHHKLAALHESLLQGKLPRNLHWSDALELIASIGQVEPTSGTEFAFVVGAQREFFKRPRGARVPEETSFYEEVAKALVPAQEIVLIGSGTGKSSAVDALVAYLKKHHPDVSRKVVATEIADLSALTAPDIEAIAKRHLLSA